MAQLPDELDDLLKGLDDTNPRFIVPRGERIFDGRGRTAKERVIGNLWEALLILSDGLVASLRTKSEVSPLDIIPIINAISDTLKALDGVKTSQWMEG